MNATFERPESRAARNVRIVGGASRAVRVGRIRAIGRYFKDDRASLLGKAFVLFAIAYVVFPFDAIPDVVPVVGWLDDIGVVSLAMWHLSRVISRYRDAAPTREDAGAELVA